MARSKTWFKPKKYPHIGLPITVKDRRAVESYVHNTGKIAHHSFLPLIKRVQRSHRYKQENGKYKRSTKEREICYASHFDAQIYSFYAKRLERRYEKYIKEHDYSDCVIAYRSIQCEDRNSSKCNIDFAKDAFNAIRNMVVRGPQTVLVSDITKFFDSLNHSYLKRAWKEVSDYNSLPEDEYNIFKNVTQFSYVKIEDLFNLYKDQIICQTKTGIRKRRLTQVKYLKEKGAIAFCEKDALPELRNRGFIHPNKNKYGHFIGIPQGLPISSVLANIYMWEFDQKLNSYLRQIGGYYRRYCDDIIMIFPSSHLQIVERLLQELIRSTALEISPDKTKRFSIAASPKGEIMILKDGKPSKIEYLGFSFDGKNIRIKDKGMSKYYHKMDKTIRARMFYAIHINNDTGGKLFVRQILRRFTPIGSRKHRIFYRRAGSKAFIDSGKVSFGNYWTYVSKSAKICDSPAIIHQMKRNKAILRRRIKLATNKVNSERQKRFDVDVTTPTS